MSSDTIHAVEGVTARVRAVEAKAAKLVAFRDRLVSDLAKKEKEVVALSDRAEKLAKVGELLRTLLDKLVDKQVRIIEDVVTEGFRSVFHDQVLNFEAEVSQKRDRTHIEFFIRQGAKEDPLSHRGSPLASFGGGPSSLASLTLRVLAILRLKLFPFLALDEALGAVSPEYVEHTSRFIKGLSDKMGIDTLLVTQEHAFIEHADRASRCSTEEVEGVRRLTIRSLK